ncbi:hypothetical protein [Bradyrhizobium sp. USDA 3256]
MMGSHNQPQIVASVRKSSGRGEYRVLLRDFSDQTVKCEIRIYERGRDHDWEASARHLVIGREYLVAIAEGLLRADALLNEAAA